MIAVGVTSLLLVGGYGGFVWYVYNEIAAVPGGYGSASDNRPDRFEITSGDFEGNDTTPYWMGEYENVSIDVPDEEIVLDGWFVPGAEEMPVILMVHGVSSSKASGQLLMVTGMLNRNGFNMLLIDLRDHGLSTMEDGRHSAGVKEYRDVLAAFDWLQSEKNFSAASIGLYGTSLGAGVVAVAFSEDSSVPCVGMSSPFSNMQAIAEEEAGYHGMGYLRPVIRHSLTLIPMMGGDDLTSKPPIEAVHNAGQRPMFIVHSKLDDRIAIHHTEYFIEEAEKNDANLTTWILDRGGHGQEPFTHPAELEEKLTTFFDSCLSRR